MEWISECTLKDLSNDMTQIPKLKIGWRRGKQYSYLIGRVVESESVESHVFSWSQSQESESVF